jgi:hypothetical protein
MVRRGGLFSVALSRGSPRVAVSHHLALWSPDVPRRCALPGAPGPQHRRDRLTDSSVIQHRSVGLLAGHHAGSPASSTTGLQHFPQPVPPMRQTASSWSRHEFAGVDLLGAPGRPRCRLRRGSSSGTKGWGSSVRGLGGTGRPSCAGPSARTGRDHVVQVSGNRARDAQSGGGGPEPICSRCGSDVDRAGGRFAGVEQPTGGVVDHKPAEHRVGVGQGPRDGRGVRVRAPYRSGPAFSVSTLLPYLDLAVSPARTPNSPVPGSLPSVRC